MLGKPDWLDKLSKLGDPPPPSNYVPGEIKWEWKCEGGFLIQYGHYTTYPGVNGVDPSVGRNPTAIPCDPKESDDPNGPPAANANSIAQPTYNVQAAPQGSSPAPPRAGCKHVSAAIDRVVAAAQTTPWNG